MFTIRDTNEQFMPQEGFDVRRVFWCGRRSVGLLQGVAPIVLRRWVDIARAINICPRWAAIGKNRVYFYKEL